MRTRDNMLFAVGDRVEVRRSSGKLDDNWTIIGFSQIEGVAHAIVRRVAGSQVQQKHIPLTELTELNQPVMRREEFVKANTFTELFHLLDVKGTLWGSQKRYTADELKVLINRVRLTDLAHQLPLQVIPQTGGLRRRVKALLDAEAALTRRGTGAGSFWPGWVTTIHER